MLGAVLFCTLATLQFAAVAAPAYATGTISGMVTDATTGAGLPSVTVKLCRLMPGADPDMPWRWVGEQSTSGRYDPFSPPFKPDGWFVFVVEPGRYRLEFQDTTGTHASTCWKDKVGLSTADPIDLTDGATVDAGITMGPAAHIRGIVTNRAGEPLEGIYINVHTGKWSLSQAYADTRTAADGSYDLGGLPTD